MAAVVPLDDETQADAAALFVAAHPHRAGEVASWTRTQRWVALGDAGDVVAYSAIWRVRAAKFRIDVVVAREHRKRGLGAEQLDRLIAVARAAGGRSVQARTDAADRDSIDFLLRRDFAATMAMHQLTLTLSDARHRDHRAALDALTREGVAIMTLSDLAARTPDAIAQFVSVVAATREGWPHDDPDRPGDPPSVVDWAAVVRERELDHTRAFVAERGGQLVGFAGALGTGVRPAWRGRSVATALKVAAIDAAIARGETELRTATGSPAMWHLNEKLGFRETGCELRLVRRLDSADPLR